MSRGTVKVEAGPAEGELHSECTEGRSLGNSALDGGQGAAGIAGRKDAHTALMSWFSGGTSESSRKFICDKETAARNTSANKTTVSGITPFLENQRGTHGRLENEAGNCEFPEYDSSPAFPSKAAPDDDNNSPLRNVHASLRSDLLITHGVSAKDMLYLIKREETRETGDFWVKVDRAKNKSHCWSLTKGREIIRTDAGCVKTEAQEDVCSIQETNETQTSTSFHAEESPLLWRNHRTLKTSAVIRRELPGVSIPTDLSDAPSGKQSLMKNRSGVYTPDTDVRCSGETEGLPQRALQPLRDVRKNASKDTVGEPNKKGGQERPRKCEERLPHVEKRKKGSTPFGAAATRSDLRLEDDFCSFIPSASTENALQTQLDGQYAGTEGSDSRPPYLLTLVRDIPLKKRPGKSTVRSDCGQMSSIRKTELERHKSASLSVVLTAHGGTKVQAVSRRLRKRNVQAARAAKAGQISQVFITAAENSKAPINLRSGMNRTLQRREDAPVAGMTFFPMNARQSQTQPEIQATHDRLGQHAGEEQAGKIVLEVGAQGQKTATSLREERRQSSQQHKGADQRKAEAEGDTEVPPVWQKVSMLGTEQKASSGFAIPEYPPTQLHQANQQHWAECGKEGTLTDYLMTTSTQEETSGGKEDVSGMNRSIEHNLVAREGTSERRADAHQLAISRAQPPRCVWVASRLKTNEIEKDGENLLRELSSSKERQESSCSSSRLPLPPASDMSAKVNRELSSLFQGRIRTQASDCSGVDQGGGEKADERRLRRFCPRGSSSSPDNFAGRLSRIRGNRTPVLNDRDRTIENMQTRREESSHNAAVTPWRARVQTHSGDDQNSVHTINQLRCANASQTAQDPDDMPSSALKRWPEVLTRIHRTGGHCRLKKCALKNQLHEQQLKKTQFLNKDLEPPDWNEQDGVRPKTRSASDSLSKASKEEDMTPLSLCRSSVHSKPREIRNGSQERKLILTLQRLRKMENRTESNANRRSKSSAEMPDRQGKRLRRQPEGIEEQKTVDMKRWTSRSKSSRLQRLASVAAQTKPELDVRRLLCKTERGDESHTDELVGPWLNYSSNSGESSYRTNYACGRKTGMRSRPRCDGDPAELQHASQTLNEEEKTSQSSNDASRGWINIGKDDLQEPDDDQCLLDVFRLRDDRKPVFSSRAYSKKTHSSSDVTAGEEVDSVFPAVALSAAEPLTAVYGRRDTVRSGMKHHDSRLLNESMGNSVQKNSSSMTSDPCTEGVEGVVQPQDGPVEQRQTKLVRNCTCDHSCDDSVISNGYKADSGGECMVEHSIYEDVGNFPHGSEGRSLGPHGGMFNSHISSSRGGWETLEKRSTMSLTREHYEQGTHVLKGESEDTEKHAFPLFFRRALGICGATRKGAGAGFAGPKAEDRQAERKQNSAKIEAGVHKFAAVKEVSWRKAKRDETRQDEACSCKSFNSSSIKDKDIPTQNRNADSISFADRMPLRSNVSDLGLLGPTVERWSFLNTDWNTHEDREKKKDLTGEDARDEKELDSGEDPFSCQASAASMEHLSLETHGKSTPRRVSSGKEKRNLKRRGERFSEAGHLGKSKRNICTRGSLARVAVSKDRPEGATLHEIERNGKRIDFARNSSCRQQRLNGNSDISVPYRRVGCRGNTKGHSSYRSATSSMFRSTSGSVYRSMSSERHQSATDDSCASSTTSEGNTHRAAVNKKCVNLHATLGQCSLLSTADMLKGRWLQADIHNLGDFLQPNAAGLHPLPASFHSSRTLRRLDGKARAKNHRRGATSSRRSMNKVAHNKGIRSTISDWHGREGRVLLKHLEENVGCEVFSAGRESVVANQATIHMLRLGTRDNCGAPAAAQTPVKEWRHMRCPRVASLDSESSIRVKNSMGACTDSSDSGNNTSKDLFGQPAWTLFRTSAAQGERLTYQGSSRASRSYPVVSPLSSAAAHLYGVATYSPATETELLRSSAPFSFPAPIATPLRATGAQTAKLESPVYFNGNAAVCRSRLPRCSVGAVVPTEAAGVARTQSPTALAGGISGTAVLFARHSPQSTSTANRHRNAETSPTATDAPPSWRRWPEAVLHVVGLPLRCVVQVLGLNVSGAFDCWREKIRQRSLRGFLTLCLLDGVVCAATVWAVCHISLLASRAAFRAAYLHVHGIDTERASHYFDGFTYRFWGKRPLYFTDNPLLGAGRAADAEIATDPWNGLHQLQQRGIAWYQHHMYGNL